MTPAAAVDSTSLAPVVTTTSSHAATAAASASTCPPPDAAEREHCVWFRAAPGVTGIDLVKRMKAAGFPAEAEGPRVYAYWKPDTIERFFSAKPGYVRTGGSSGGTVCILVLPDRARPPKALLSSIEGWAIDDPVCEL